MPSDSERKAVKATVTPRKVNIPKLARKIAKQMFIDGRGKKCLQLRMCDDFDGTGWGESGVAYAIETQLRLALEPKP